MLQGAAEKKKFFLIKKNTRYKSLNVTVAFENASMQITSRLLCKLSLSKGDVIATFDPTPSDMSGRAWQDAGRWSLRLLDMMA